MKMKKINILMVDDDRRLCETLKDILTEKGYGADFVESGTEALKALESSQYDVILLDMKMPVVNGLETFREIKKISPRTAVIIMTAFSLDDMIKDCLREGAFGILYKPLDIDKLVARIKEARDSLLIMVVDDDPLTRRTLKDILTKKGFLVSVAKDGEEAIKITKQMPHHIVIVDMKLPTLNGLETYLAIREVNPKVKAILMTAYREETADLVKDAIKKSAYICLYKPFKPSCLLDIIKEVTEI